MLASPPQPDTHNGLKALPNATLTTLLATKKALAQIRNDLRRLTFAWVKVRPIQTSAPNTNKPH
jgi:hypothetical protein